MKKAHFHWGNGLAGAMLKLGDWHGAALATW